MFNYIRIFSLVSLVCLIGAAYSVGLYYKHLASNDIVSTAVTGSASLAQGYINTVWKKHNTTFLRLARIDASKWKNYREFQMFHRDTIAFFKNMPVNEMRIYLKTGTLIMSSSPGSENAQGDMHITYPPFEEALAGDIGMKLLNDREYFTSTGQRVYGTLISTYAPIYVQNYARLLSDKDAKTVEAVIRIDLDITEQWNQLTHFQYVAVVGIVGIFVLILGFLIYFSRRTETIIAKQHEINLELTAAAATAESENRDKSMFLANISHELRTPLNAVIGFSEILGADIGSTLSEQHRGYIHDIHGSGKHLLSLINDILEYSKAEAGKLEVDLSEIDGNKMVKNSIRLMIPRAEEAQVTLLEELPKKPFIMQTDAKKLKQVLLNLVSNAVKFTPPGGQVKVSAWQDKTGKRVIFTVRDTGIGIEPKDISKVMTPFGQVDSELSRRYEGTGLGLPLSKRLVELMEGTFRIESEVGIGTTITLNMPLTLAA